jgi:hypothetical protein
MSSIGWLDIHGHFGLPLTSEEAWQQVQAFRKSHFLILESWIYDVDKVLAYLDRANISMQMLSNIPRKNFQHFMPVTIPSINRSTASFTLRPPRCPPHRQLRSMPQNFFGTTNERTPSPDGFTVSTVYNGIWFSNRSLDPVWEELNSRSAVIHIHPDTFAPGAEGRPTALIELAFDTARTVVDMLYSGWFRRYPNIRLVLAHARGSLPTLSGHLALLGGEPWVPNPEKLTKKESIAAEHAVC